MMNIDWKYWPVARIFKGIFTIGFIVMAIVGADWFLLVPALFFGIQQYLIPVAVVIPRHVK